MIRFVLDTDVIIAALRSPSGASAALLIEVLHHKASMLCSVPLFCEYEAKCTEPKHCQAANITEAEAKIFVSGLAALIEPVRIHFLWRPTLRDPNDEMVLETAVNGQADAIVSFNQRDFGTVPARFTIELLTPAVAIRRIRHEQ